jgi:hypothetical protein
MEEVKVKVHQGPRKQPEEVESTVSGKEAKPPIFIYFILKSFLVLLKIFTILMLIFSIQNISDIFRAIPSFGAFSPSAGWIASYLVAQAFCAYVCMVYLGSAGRYFYQLIPTLFHFTGFILVTVVMPLAFVLTSGFVLRSAERLSFAAQLSVPFSWVPVQINRYFEDSGSFLLYIVLTVFSFLVFLTLVNLLQRWVDKIKPTKNKV